MGKKKDLEEQVERLQGTIDRTLQHLRLSHARVDHMRDETRCLHTEIRHLRAVEHAQDAEHERLQRHQSRTVRERDDARAQRDVLQGRLDKANQALNPKSPVTAAGDPVGFVETVSKTALGMNVTMRIDNRPLIRSLVSAGVPAPQIFVDTTDVHVGQVRRNKDYHSTLIRVLSPPRQARYGTDDTWLVKYLNTGRTERRTTSFIRYYYPGLRMVRRGSPAWSRPRPRPRPRPSSTIGRRNPFTLGSPNWFRWDREHYHPLSSISPF